MAREPKTSVSDIISALESLSAIDLGKVIKAAQEQLETKRESGKKELLEEVRAKAEALGISLEELIGRPAQPARPESKTRFKRAAREAKTPKPAEAKYRNAETGETWSGRGRMPRWLKQAEDQGRSRDEYAAAG
jgi:DNA-binding protein H-NS